MTLLSDSEADWPDFSPALNPRPDECAHIERFVDFNDIHAYEQGLGDISGDVYLTDDSVLVLQVVGDPQPHRNALATGVREACVIEVRHNKRAQYEIMDELRGKLSTHFDSYGMSKDVGGRVTVGLPVVDEETAWLVASLVEDPSAVRIIGLGVLLP